MMLIKEKEEAWFESYGKIIYDPRRPGLKKKNKWWTIVTVDREITRYFRWQVLWNWGIKLNQPSWDAHVSIIRGEKPRSHEKMKLWKKYHGQKVKFRYSNRVINAADKPQFWFVEIDCPMLRQIRDEFGVPSNWKSHLTVGRTW